MQRNKNLSCLRGIFIMMIVFHHLDLYDGGGSLAVSFFFMLGGFALSLGYYDKVNCRSFSYRSFIKKRCEKFFPLHWLCLTAFLPFMLYGIIKSGTSILPTLEKLLCNAFLLQSLIPVKSVYFSFNAVSWYLSDTIIFAFVFPFIVKGLSRLSMRWKITVFIVMLFSYSILVYLLPVEYRHAILYISPLVRIIDFILGIYVFLLYKKLTSLSREEIENKWRILITMMMMLVAVITSITSSSDTVLIAGIYWIPLFVILINSMFVKNGGG